MIMITFVYDEEDKEEAYEIVKRLQLLAPRLGWGEVGGEGGRPGGHGHHNHQEGGIYPYKALS